MWTSLWQRPAASTLTRTSPGPGSGTGTSRSTGSRCQPSRRTASISGGSLVDERDGFFRTGRGHLFGSRDPIVRNREELVANRGIALVVIGHDVRRDAVAAAVAHADTAVDAQLHDLTSHTSGSWSSVIIEPPPRSTSSSPAAMPKSGIRRSHSSTAIFI